MTGSEDAGELGGGEGTAAGGGCFDCDDHEGGTVEDGLEGGVDDVVGFVRKLFDIIHGAIADDRYRFCVVQGVCDEGFQLRETCRIVVSNELVDEDDLIVYGSRKGVGLCEEVVFGVVLDRAYKGCLLL